MLAAWGHLWQSASTVASGNASSWSPAQRGSLSSLWLLLPSAHLTKFKFNSGTISLLRLKILNHFLANQYSLKKSYHKHVLRSNPWVCHCSIFAMKKLFFFNVSSMLLVQVSVKIYRISFAQNLWTYCLWNKILIFTSKNKNKSPRGASCSPQYRNQYIWCNFPLPPIPIMPNLLFSLPILSFGGHSPWEPLGVTQPIWGSLGPYTVRMISTKFD